MAGTTNSPALFNAFTIFIYAIFDDLFSRYTKTHELVSVKSTNMGSLFRLTYEIKFIDKKLEKEFVDQIRCRNGNLEIQLERINYQAKQDL